MNDSTHTPGPWHIGFKDGSGGLSDNEGAYIVGYVDSDLENVVVVGGSDDWSLPFGVVNEADAHLIAAAPDLLAAAIKAEANLTNIIALLRAARNPSVERVFADSLGDLKAAIQKARGG